MPMCLCALIKHHKTQSPNDFTSDCSHILFATCLPIKKSLKTKFRRIEQNQNKLGRCPRRARGFVFQMYLIAFSLIPLIPRTCIRWTDGAKWIVPSSLFWNVLKKGPWKEPNGRKSPHLYKILFSTAQEPTFLPTISSPSMQLPFRKQARQSQAPWVTTADSIKKKNVLTQVF